MGTSAESAFTGRSPVELEDGQEVVYYDPTEAVEEHAVAAESKSLGGVSVDQGRAIDSQDADSARSAARIVAVAMRGQEEPFGYLSFPTVLPVSASDPDEAMAHARRHLKRIGLSPYDFMSFDLTTHFYLGPLGKRVCGWSFSFSQGAPKLLP